MKRTLITILIYTMLSGVTLAYAESTKRVPQFSNDNTNVWKTIIYPTSTEVLKMHRHGIRNG